MKVFETYESVENMRGCRKRPIIIHALQMQEEFRVKSLEGDWVLGKPGDFLMRGAVGELYICDQEVWKATYDWVEE